MRERGEQHRLKVIGVERPVAKVGRRHGRVRKGGKEEVELCGYELE